MFQTWLVLENQLSGVMIWSLDLDDFNGLCKGIRSPVLKFIQSTLIFDILEIDVRNQNILII